MSFDRLTPFDVVSIEAGSSSLSFHSSHSFFHPLSFLSLPIFFFLTDFFYFNNGLSEPSSSYCISSERKRACGGGGGLKVFEEKKRRILRSLWNE